jgi:hypothetical protein
VKSGKLSKCSVVSLTLPKIGSPLTIFGMTPGVPHHGSLLLALALMGYGINIIQTFHVGFLL